MNITEDSDWTKAGAEMTEDTVCRTAGRCYVDSLLIFSEISFSNASLYAMPVPSPWEQVKGWNECPPLACLFQLQNKCKTVKTEAHAFHCPLCIDANLAQKPEEELCALSESAETECSSTEDLVAENIILPIRHQETPKVSPSENSCSETEVDSFNYKKTATIQSESSKVTGRAKPKRHPDTFPALTYIKLAVQCPIMKERRIISKFSVLPPVKGSGHPRGVRLRSVPASVPSSSARLTTETRSYCLPLTEGGHVEGERVPAGANLGAEEPEDGRRSLTAYKCYQSQPSKRLLPPFSVSLTKRCGRSLISFEETLPQAVDLLGRKIKNGIPDRGAANNNLDHTPRRTEYHLPALSGTRVSMQAMSHRMVYASNV